MKKLFFGLWVGLLLAASTSTAQAGLMVTLSNDGSGGVIATFDGRGTITLPTGFWDDSWWDELNGDPFPTIQNSYSLYTPLLVGDGISISSLIFFDGGPGRDNFRFVYDNLFRTNTSFSIDSYSTPLVGASFADLTVGMYTPNYVAGPNYGSHTLIIGSVPNPATLALFGLGLAGLGWKRRKQA